MQPHQRCRFVCIHTYTGFIHVIPNFRGEDMQIGWLGGETKHCIGMHESQTLQTFCKTYTALFAIPKTHNTKKADAGLVLGNTSVLFRELLFSGADGKKT